MQFKNKPPGEQTYVSAQFGGQGESSSAHIYIIEKTNMKRTEK